MSVYLKGRVTHTHTHTFCPLGHFPDAHDSWGGAQNSIWVSQVGVKDLLPPRMHAGRKLDSKQKWGLIVNIPIQPQMSQAAA